MHSEALDKQSEENGAQSTESARVEPLARRAQGAKQREERAKDGRHGARRAHAEGKLGLAPLDTGVRSSRWVRANWRSPIREIPVRTS